MGQVDTRADDARFRPKCDVLESMGAGYRGKPSSLPPGPARMRAADQPPKGYRYTPDKISAQILAVLEALSLPRVHWVGESSGGIIGLLLAASHPDRIASLVLCNTPSRIPDRIKQIYALDRATASDAMRAHGVGEWCRQTLGYRLDREHAGK